MADPNAKLYIEEYGAEIVNTKSNALYALAQTLKNSKVPLDGIGFEGHVVAGQIPNIGDVTSNVGRFASLDLDWAYTRASFDLMKRFGNALYSKSGFLYVAAELGVRIVNGGASVGRQMEDYISMLSACTVRYEPGSSSMHDMNLLCYYHL